MVTVKIPHSSFRAASSLHSPDKYPGIWEELISCGQYWRKEALGGICMLKRWWLGRKPAGFSMHRQEYEPEMEIRVVIDSKTGGENQKQSLGWILEEEEHDLQVVYCSASTQRQRWRIPEGLGSHLWSGLPQLILPLQILFVTSQSRSSVALPHATGGSWTR